MTGLMQRWGAGDALVSPLPTRGPPIPQTPQPQTNKQTNQEPPSNQEAQTLTPISKVRHAHERAEFETRRAARPDAYAELGASPVATEAEIKQAFKQRALETHPDKFMDR